MSTELLQLVYKLVCYDNLQLGQETASVETCPKLEGSTVHSKPAPENASFTLFPVK